MICSLFRSPRRALLGPAVLAAGLLAGALTPRAAHAMAGVAADPLVTLSNGIVLDMSTTIYDPAGLPDVQHVSYTLHLPKGVAVTRVSYPDGTGSISGFTSDNKTMTVLGLSFNNLYSSDIVATTKTRVQVTAYFKIVTMPAGQNVQSRMTATGFSGDDLNSNMGVS